MALDLTTGRERWRWERTETEEPRQVGAPRVRAGRGTPIAGERPVVVVGEQLTRAGTYLDAATGAEVAVFPDEAVDEDRRFISPDFRFLREDTGGVRFWEQLPEGRRGSPVFALYRADAAEESVDSVRVEDDRRNLFYDARNTVALADSTVLMPHTGREGDRPEPRAFSVLSIPWDGGVEEATWIEVAAPPGEEFDYPEGVEHHLLPVPGAVVSYAGDPEARTSSETPTL
ncbi:hypothetical protein [Nocardiopsis sp. MG754419]|uniref:hypothetical protein n=1 Tax=Nocardiopsis sp. MG754419 TaxID=2259865 RepID=UPI001BA88927|nr:hypothetical protein [Nocardiopsis sp. MG754419]